MLVALCPGFGAAVIGTAVIYLNHRYAFPSTDLSPLMLYGIPLAAAFCLAVLFGWLDSLLNPSLPKIEGVIALPVLLRSVAIFVAAQIIIGPIMLAGSVVLLSEIRL